ncbi:MAG: winged helix DNA-binding domain-containing protein [Chloroflexota bacterium]
MNRATLARQHLLEPVSMPVAGMIEHLVGMQSQVPTAPYVGLWTRLTAFDPTTLSTLMTSRDAVRMSLMRTTLHLVTAADALALRPLLQPVLERGLWSGSPFGRRIKGVDVDELLATGAALLEERPRTTAALGKALAERWPDYDAVSLAHAVRYLVPLVQIPPRGVWGQSMAPTWTTLDAWLDGRTAPPLTLDDLVLRYLRAFGPASVQDIQAWCWLTRLRPVVERLRSQLVTFRAEDGVELFDLQDAPRPDPDVPAPPRFVPEYDNLLLSHADRTRLIAVEYRELAFTNGAFLVDGFAVGSWKLTRANGTATLALRAFEPVSPADRAALGEEGERLLGFLAPSERAEIRFAGDDDPIG